MIPFQIVRQLKKAGFPLRECLNAQLGFAFGMFNIDGKKYLAPTIPELLYECKKELDEILIYITDDLVEVKGVNPLYGLDINIKSKTTEEALANLYLELNK